MRTTRLRPLLLLLAIACAPKAAVDAPKPAAVSTPGPAAGLAQPPIAKRQPRWSSIHGLVRVDAYQWIAQKDAPEVLEYLRAENAYTEAVMRPTEALQERLYKEMLGRIKQTDLSVPYRKRGFFYYSRTEEGKEYPIHARKKGSLDAPEEVLLDLNAMRGDHRFLSLGGMQVSDDGTKLAYSIDVTGFREYTLKVKDLATGKDLSVSIPKVSSFVWAADGKTLFYVTEDHAKRPYKVWRHVLGADPASDVSVREEGDERFVAWVSRTRDDRYVTMGLESHTTTEVWMLDARTPAGKPWVVSPREQDHEYEVEHRDGTLWIRTNDRGRHFRLVTAPVASPGKKSWKEVLPHRDDVMLEGVDVFKSHYVLFERRAALPHLTVVPFGGKPWAIEVDEAVYSLFPDANPEFDQSTYRYSFLSFTTPRTVYDVDVRTKQRKLLKREEVLGDFDPTRYASERIHATASDGTKIPVSVVYRKGVKRDGTAPLLLAGYGAYGISYPVSFGSSRLSLLDRGVVFAVAHIRGGGDLGKKWHDAGRMEAKRNTFTDFIDVAEHLVAEKYTSSDRLAITGGSAGGLLMGAVVNMRPDLFGAVLASVPFVDVVNTMLDEDLPLTVGEFEEWGNPKEKPSYDYMMTYSPYDNVTAQAYPAMLVVSAYNDSQVLYHEPAKWVAKLRATKTDSNPLLLKMDLDPAGHGGKSGRYEKLREIAFEYAWLLTTLGVEKTGPGT